MRASKIGLLILILGFGGTVETAWRVRDRLGVGAWDWRVLTGSKFSGPSFTFEDLDQAAVPADTAIEIENSFGGVKTLQGQPGQVKIALRKVVFRNTEPEAETFAGQVKVVRSLEGGTLRIGTNRRELEKQQPQVGFETHLELELPPGTRLVVRNEHGSTEVADLAQADITSSYDSVRVDRVSGPVSVDARHGDVVVADAGGALTLTARHGSVDLRNVKGKATLNVEHGDVSAHEVGGLDLTSRHGALTADGILGDLSVTGEHAGVDATAVTGRVIVESSYQDVKVARAGGDVRLVTHHGEIQASDVLGAVYAESRYADVHLARVGGPVEVRVMHGGLQAEGLEKGALVRAAGEDVVIEGFKGTLDVQSERGSVRLQPSGPLTAPVTARATQGGIELAVTAGSRFTLDATAANGEIETGVSGFTATQSGAQHVAGTMNGGGAAVTLAADGGNVELRAPSAAESDETTSEPEQIDTKGDATTDAKSGAKGGAKPEAPKKSDAKNGAR